MENLRCYVSVFLNVGEEKEFVREVRGGLENKYINTFLKYKDGIVRKSHQRSVFIMPVCYYIKCLLKQREKIIIHK